MRKKIAIVGLSALVTLGPGAQAFAQAQQQPGSERQAPASQPNQTRDDDGFPWGLLGLLGLGGLAGLRRRDHDGRRVDRTSPATAAGFTGSRQ
jgi:MYXO-CTERM domain-containing protein